MSYLLNEKGGRKSGEALKVRQRPAGRTTRTASV